MAVDTRTYGPNMAGPLGWTATLDQVEGLHLWGGDGWQLIPCNNHLDAPSLLLTLDLGDPRLESLKTDTLNELPLCSYITSDAWVHRQVFQIIPDLRRIVCLELEAPSIQPLDEEDRFPNPLPTRRLTLCPMARNDYPIDEQAYWDACETFVGGPSFIRVLGPPLWLQRVEEQRCGCDKRMGYVASIGYENVSSPSGILPGRAFFIGEGALYFFFCRFCLEIVVISQST